MPSQLSMSRLNKDVRIWSDRRKRSVTVRVDYERISNGPFTLIHISRMRDDAGADTEQELPPFLARFVRD